MRPRRTIIGFGLVAALVVPTSTSVAGAQEPPGLRIESVDVSSYPSVEAIVSVPARLGGEEVGFSVRENDEERAVDVEAAEAGDLNIALLIDVTGSMVGPALEAAKDAANAFIDQLPDDVSVAVLSYDTDLAVVSGFDESRQSHRDGIAGLAADGETAMYDAVAEALDLFPGEEGASNALVLLTDGEDNASETDVDEVVGHLASSGILFRGVEYQTAYSERAGIRAMAAATGGTVAEADDPDALVGTYEQLAADLVNRYSLRYDSTASGSVMLEVDLTSGDDVATASRGLELPAVPPPAPTNEESSPEPTVATPSVARGWLIVGAVPWFLALLLLFWSLFTPVERRSQIAGVARRRGAETASGLTQHVTAMTGRTLTSHGYDRGLNAALERAGIDLRPEEFVVLAGSAVVTAFFAGVLLRGLLLGLVFAVIAALAARSVVRFRTRRRQRQFAEQLSDTLQLLSGSLRAGYSLMQAIDAVAREADAPASEEFSRVVLETRLGRDTRDALHALAGRMGGEDLNWVVQAIEIHREVGGDLAEVLDTVGGTIRERDQIRRQVKALSAEGRLSAWVLLALPAGVGGIIFLTNRPYIMELPTGGLLGWGMMAVGAVLMTVGVFWMRHLVKLQF